MNNEVTLSVKDVTKQIPLGREIISILKGVTFDLHRGVKFETNVKLGVDPKNLTDVRKADVNFGFVRRF